MVQYLLPDLIVPEKEEDIQLWAKKILLFTSFATSYNWNAQDIRRYQYRNGAINAAEFTHVTQLYSMNETDNAVVLPSFIRQINPIDAMVKRQIGSLMTQPFNFTTYVNDETSIEDKKEEVAQMALTKLSKALRQTHGIDKEIGMPLHEGDEFPISLEDLKAINFDKHKTEWEKIYESLTDLFVNLPDIAFKQKFYHEGGEALLTCNKVIFKRYYDEQLQCPSLRPIDPRNFWYLPTGYYNKFIDEYPLCCDVQWLTLEEVIASDPSLSDEDIEKLKEIRTLYYNNALQAWFNTNANNLGFGPTPNGYNSWFGTYYQGDILSRTFRIKVVNAEWKANMKVRYKKIPDSLDGSQTIMKKVDAKKKINVDKGESEDIRWEERSFGGVIYGHFMIGTVIHDVTMAEHKDAPTKVKTNYCGIIDPRPSFVDNLIDLQNLRIQAFHKLELIGNQISGKILVIDKAAGGNILKNLYNLGAFRIMEIDSAAEGAEINPNAAQNIKTVDMELSNSYVQLLNWLAYLDAQMSLMTGQNDAASGNMKDYASNGLAAQQLAQAQLVNVPYIDNFFTVGSRLLQGLCDMVPSVWKGKKISKYYLSDNNQRRLVDLQLPENYEDFPNVSVHVVYSPSDMMLKQDIVASANQLLATTTSPDIMNAIFKMKLAPTAKQAQTLFEESVTKVNKDKQEEMATRQQELAAQQQAMLQAKIAPAQIQSDAHVKGKQVQANAEIQKQALKNEGEGVKVDAEKANAIDLAVANSHLGGGQQ